MRPNALLPFLVSLKPDAPVGLYPIRVVSRRRHLQRAAVQRERSARDRRGRIRRSAAIERSAQGRAEGHAARDRSTARWSAPRHRQLHFPPPPGRSWSSKWKRGAPARPSIPRSRSSTRPGTRSRKQRRRARPGRRFPPRSTPSPRPATIASPCTIPSSASRRRISIASRLAATTMPTPVSAGLAPRPAVEVTLFGGNLEQPVKVAADVSAKSAVGWRALAGLA